MPPVARAAVEFGGLARRTDDRQMILIHDNHRHRPRIDDRIRWLILPEGRHECSGSDDCRPGMVAPSVAGIIGHAEAIDGEMSRDFDFVFHRFYLTWFCFWEAQIKSAPLPALHSISYYGHTVKYNT